MKLYETKAAREGAGYHARMRQHIVDGIAWRDLPDVCREQLCALWLRFHDEPVEDVLKGCDGVLIWHFAAYPTPTALVQLLRDRAMDYAERMVAAEYAREWEAHRAPDTYAEESQ